MPDVKVDHIGFNADYWSKKSEKEFVDECLRAGNHPPHISEADARNWLREAYKAIKGEPRETPADKPAA